MQRVWSRNYRTNARRLTVVLLLTASACSSIERRATGETVPDVGSTTTTYFDLQTTVPEQTTTTTSTIPPVTTTVLRARDVRVLYRLPVKKKVVFITIDDGGFISDSLVRYLNTHHIPVTSFVMPEPLVWQWGQYRRIKSMTFENHSNTHGHMRRMTFAQQKEEICRAGKIIRRRTKASPILFRPPGGDWNDTTKRAMAACGVRYLVLWNAIADDQIIRMRPSWKLLPGDIILMHYRKSLISSLQWLMEQIRHDGLKPALLRDYVKYGD